MKKITFIVLCSLGLLGCISSHVDYFSVKPTATSYSGIWVGKYENLLMTLKLNPDGTGVICDDYMGKAKLQSTKFSNGRLYGQTGHSIQILDVKDNKMTVKYPFAGQNYFLKDDIGEHITPACKELLK